MNLADEDWRTRLTTADGSSLEVDPDLLKSDDETDFKKTRFRTTKQQESRDEDPVLANFGSRALYP